MSNVVTMVGRLVKSISLIPVLAAHIFANLYSNTSIRGDGEAVVSLTTYSTRSRYVFLTIESIASGTVKPGRIILWIDDESILASLPSTLRRLLKRGLEVRATKNYGPHKKYFSYLDSESEFRVPLVTADDDIIYPAFWLQGLLSSYRSFPEMVSCYRAHTMSISNMAIDPYRTWRPCNHSNPSYRTFSTGASGAVYPPELLVALQRQGSAFMDIAPRADDVWLHATAVGHGFKTRQIGRRSLEFPVIPGTQGMALSRHNVSMDGNDRQIDRAYTNEHINVLSAGNQS